MELYTLASKYHLCTPPPNMTPPPRLSDLLGDLYRRLQDFLKTHLVGVVARATGLTGEAMVSFYTHNFDDYKLSSKLVNGMCSFVNRTWVKFQGENGVLQVYEMALESWREHCLTPLREQLTGGLLKLVEMDRNGDTEAFENVFLIESQLFYIRESADFLARQRFTRYMARPTGSNRCAGCFQGHVRHKVSTAVGRAGDDAARDPRLYANTLLQVYYKYKTLVTNVFANDEGSPAPASGGEKFEVSGATGQILQPSAAKNTKNPDLDDVEEALKEATILFSFIEDKEVFQRSYTKMMAMRLVQDTSVSEEAETSMILKFREVCGHEYTPKLLRMIQDIRLSTILNERFDQSLADAGENLGLDFSVLRCLRRFEEFYPKAKPNRTITWLYHVSEGELVTGCFGRTYLLQATAVQIAVIIQYNHSPSLSVQQLREATGLDMETLQQVLQVLLDVRLLQSGEQEQSNSKARRPLLSPDSVLTVDEEFSCRRVLVDIRPRAMSEPAEVEQEGTADKSIKANRKFAIQAAIVRVMKYRQTLGRPEIVAEVTSLLASRFKPEVIEIGECIEILVEKHYLETAQGDEGTYNYVA
ncbi:hypothetical protein HPB48_026440 [Haemaphysalis longicornis]|uniref:Cullin family profile domain-containing protein n=1 Tax=Haemaphysalis longicornis TaxID=44386 RepID=A0A9J6HBX3_HAELO|nr:hypothetical protein HPB48_026440 [Haemaphysalis longicornis]